MSRKPVVFIGAGGHAKSVADCLNIDEYRLIGFIDNHKQGTHLDLPIFGDGFDCVPDAEQVLYFVSIGSNEYRRFWFSEIIKRGYRTFNIIAPTAFVSPRATIGIGNFVAQFAFIGADVRLGDDNIVNTRAIVEHECVVGNHIHLSTGSIINGGVSVSDGVFLGSGAVCNGQISLGAGTIIGSGAAVIRDMPPHITAVGVPAVCIKRHQDGD